MKGILVMFVHFNESMQIINDQKIDHYKTKKLYLIDTLGYVLAEDIIADHNSPALPTSAMDGYAFKHDDICLGRLRITSINPAGSDKKEKIVNGTCIKTFTGSLMPEGADTLIPIENVEVDGDEIIIKKEVPFGYSVREIGENYSKGQNLIPKGTKIDFPQIGVMASLNIVSPLVYEKPKVSIISTGSELLDLGDIQTNNAQIRSSNNYTLEAIVRKYGGIPLQMGCINDDIESITNAISDALEQSDIVVTTGGVSVGDFDFVEDVIVKLGAEVLFKGVHIKPGKPVMVARKGNKFIVGLPGFAYASTVTALLYLLPLIATFQQGEPAIHKIKATLTEPFNKRAKKAEFTACNLTLVDGKYQVDFQDKKTRASANLTNMLGNSSLLFTSEEDRSKEKGEEVTIYMLN